MPRTALNENRIVILAPRGRDHAVIAQVLARSGATTEVCGSIEDCVACLHEGAGAAVMTEEAIAGADTTSLFAWLDAQPAWSDIPLIVLATRQSGRRSETAMRILERLGSVVLLERPVNAETLTSAAASALRARRRQYEARALLMEREQTHAELRELNEDLERRVGERTQDLQAAHEALAFALDAARMGTWDLDLVTDKAHCSPQHYAIFGYAEPLADWSRATFAKHVIADDLPAVEAAFADAVRSGRLEFECRIRRANGTERWIAVKGEVKYDREGTPTRMAGILSDNTDQHVTEDALRQAQKMEAIGQLTGGVAHDFNNLLTVIVGGLDMILRRPEQIERVTRLADAAMTAARRGEQLTQQLLAFSRRQMLRPQTLNPNRLLLDFRPLATRAAGERVDLEFDLDPSIDPIQIDPAQFEAAVLNLIVNARDAMEARPSAPRILISSRNIHLDPAAVVDRGVPPGAYVEISVADRGCGISPEALTHVFEPFFTTKEVGRGTGLGLSQVYGFARSAKGFVSIDSEVDVGTVIKICVPRSSDPVGEEDVAASATIPLRRAGEGETILLVEDDEQVLRMAIESLEELRYSVIVARNAAEALEILREVERIDILFSDVVMPGGMNGSQLAAEAARLRPGLKVLLTSGYVADLDEGQIIGRGDLPVLNKPYRRDELARSLHLVLRGDAAHTSH